MKNPGDSQYLVKVHTPQPTHTYRAPRTAHCAALLCTCPPPVGSPCVAPCVLLPCAPTSCVYYLVCILPRAYRVQAEDGSCTAMEYDLAKAKETRTQLLMGGCICVGVHYKFGYMQARASMCICMHPLRRSPARRPS